MGVTHLQHRIRIMAAVAELAVGGATQVYIRAAGMGWKILKEEEKREIPRNLLRKMLKMKMRSEGVQLKEFPLQNVRMCAAKDIVLIILYSRLTVSPSS
jgi:hypothetical protein